MANIGLVPEEALLDKPAVAPNRILIREFGTVKITKDLSAFPQNTRKHAIGMMTAFGVYEYDERLNRISLSSSASEGRSELSKKDQLVPMWASFAIGVECLLKAVLCKHECMPIQKGKVSERAAELNPVGTNHAEALRVLSGAGGIEVTADTNRWLAGRLQQKRIDKLYDIDTRPLMENITTLKKLVQNGLITKEERWSLHNSLLVLKDVRRNVDVHTFYSLTIGGSFCGDLENLYMPAVNLLLDVYNRVPT